MADDIMQVDKSPYAYAWNTPIVENDPDGNCPMCVGAIVGAAIDYGTQVAVNYGTGNENPWTDVDGKSILVSAGAGATGAGFVSLVNKGAKSANLSSKAKTVLTATGELVLDGGVNAGAQLAMTGEVDAEKVVIGALAGQMIRSPVRDKVKGNADAKQAQIDRSVKRSERVGRNTEARANPTGNAKPKGRMSKAQRQYREARNQRQQSTNHRTATVVRSVGSGVGASTATQKAYNYFRETNNVQN